MEEKTYAQKLIIRRIEEKDCHQECFQFYSASYDAYSDYDDSDYDDYSDG